MRILIVDDNTDSLKSLSVVLSDLGHEPLGLMSAEEALETVRDEYFPLIITDIRMPGMDGLELLTHLKQNERTQESDIVIITGHGDMETAVESLRRGAYDYLNKPINARELAAVVDRSAEHQFLLLENKDWENRFKSRVDEATEDLRQDLAQVRDRLRKVVGIGGVVAESMAMRRLLDETRVYHSDTSVPVLIEGETGTGKEIMARLVHYGEGGIDAPFVAINCSAIPMDLFESELFGHDPGAYTGSTRRGSPGKLELAGQGTLFLDEVGEMPLPLQPKLLRVLEDRSFYRVGGLRRMEFTARVVCAANRNLAEMVEAGQFRRDLYHRLKVGHLVIPPLRERRNDIEPLARHFLARETERKKKNFQSIAPVTLEILRNFDWPGNVRELENVIERAVLINDSETLKPGHVDFLLGDAANAPKTLSPGALTPENIILPDTPLNLDELTRQIMYKALDRFAGNKTRAAEYLGISRYSLHRRLQKD